MSKWFSKNRLLFLDLGNTYITVVDARIVAKRNIVILIYFWQNLLYLYQWVKVGKIFNLDLPIYCRIRGTPNSGGNNKSQLTWAANYLMSKQPRSPMAHELTTPPVSYILVSYFRLNLHIYVSARDLYKQIKSVALDVLNSANLTTVFHEL